MVSPPLPMIKPTQPSGTGTGVGGPTTIGRVEAVREVVVPQHVFYFNGRFPDRFIRLSRDGQGPFQRVVCISLGGNGDVRT